MQDTSIAWCDWTWNPIRGCSRISPGCINCYAEKLAARHSVVSEKRMSPPFEDFAEFRIIGGKREAHWTGKVELIEEKLLEPLSWRRKAAKFREQHGRKPRAFISMSDLFHENLPDEAIDRVLAVAALTPEINYMFLTKRAERMEKWAESYVRSPIIRVYQERQLSRSQAIAETIVYMDGVIGPECLKWISGNDPADLVEWPLPNVALGVSVESQKYADERIPHLLRTPAAMRFVSYEPALESVDWEYPESIWPKGPQMCCPGPSMECGCMGLPVDPPLIHGIDMIIVGGESGPGARPFDIAWPRSTVRQCRAAGVAPFVKQMGARVVTCRGCDDPACKEPQSYRDRKGEDMSEWPEDLRDVREWPEGWA